MQTNLRQTPVERVGEVRCRRHCWTATRRLTEQLALASCVRLSEVHPTARPSFLQTQLSFCHSIQLFVTSVLLRFSTGRCSESNCERNTSSSGAHCDVISSSASSGMSGGSGRCERRFLRRDFFLRGDVTASAVVRVAVLVLMSESGCRCELGASRSEATLLWLTFLETAA